MDELISPLILQLLEWISRQPRTYVETMDAWRSTCPRLTVWEDAWIDGLVTVETREEGPHESKVILTPRGRLVLAQHSGVSSTGKV